MGGSGNYSRTTTLYETGTDREAIVTVSAPVNGGAFDVTVFGFDGPSPTNYPGVVPTESAGVGEARGATSLSALFGAQISLVDIIPEQKGTTNKLNLFSAGDGKEGFVGGLEKRPEKWEEELLGAKSDVKGSARAPMREFFS